MAGEEREGRHWPCNPSRVLWSSAVTWAPSVINITQERLQRAWFYFHVDPWIRFNSSHRIRLMTRKHNFNVHKSNCRERKDRKVLFFYDNQTSPITITPVNQILFCLDLGKQLRTQLQEIPVFQSPESFNAFIFEALFLSIWVTTLSDLRCCWNGEEHKFTESSPLASQMKNLKKRMGKGLSKAHNQHR